MGALLPATLSGQGPDVAMMVGNDLPMNFGIRGAVADLAKFDDFDEIQQAFLPSAMVPYRFRERVFALPETQTFSMLFYRKDILHELGLDIPQTWDDVRAALSVLSKSYMDFGLPVGSAGGAVVNHVDHTFAMFLFQAGGDIYDYDGRRSLLDSDISVATFREFTKFFTDFRLPNPYDFANRFRFGEMPLAIADYTSYNMLQVFAPEIRGLWGFTLVPGTPQEDGTIDHTVPTGGSATVIMERARDHEAAWEFIKWWTSAEVQTQFGRGMESLMGPAARPPTANQQAFEMLPWPVNDFRNIKAQFAWARGVPQVPGGYFTPRQVNNAFYTVVTEERVGPREALTDHVRYINDEINNKRREFNLD
jgi:ABC-type glycerol-3-phosphate transport system substrate-binding protein